jgi:aminoglycoside/choline kinase family phosphotransferase
MTAPYDTFLNSHFSKTSTNFKVYQLAGDASSRKYFRVISHGEGSEMGTQSWVLMQWEPFDAATYPFLSVLKHLEKHNVHVPKVIAMSPGEGLMLLEDLGDLTLERKFWESQSQEVALPFYKKAVDEILKIHCPATFDRTDCTAFGIQFDTEKLLWEMKYGKDNLINGICQFQFKANQEAELMQILTKICQRLDKEPKYIAHRDYHSRNLMIKFDEMRVIDFQDARMGAIQYDLVSLFRDSYVNLSDEMASQLMEYYLDRAREYLPKDFSLSHFYEVYEVQTIQRCFKACGSFSSFYMARKDTRYLKYITHTLKRVLKSLNEFPEYKIFSDILIDSGALERKYESL